MYKYVCKGQLMPKEFFGILNSPKQQRKKSDFSTVIPQGRHVFIRFFGEIEDAKETFRN